ncbi:MAG: glycosyltransferase family 1 protein [Ferruginibacter sp.]
MDLICFSHLSWNFVYQRPQHILSRFVSLYRVFYIEEFTGSEGEDGYTINKSNENVWIVTPNLNNAEGGDRIQRQRAVISDLLRTQKITNFFLWYYTPLSLLFSDHLQPVATVYDCMDELTAFKFADPQLKEAERLLFQKADVVFTGGNNLYEAKKKLHPNVHAFPSSIDKEHFQKARSLAEDYPDQQAIPHPRLGFFGVIDERFDIELIRQAAELRPDWQFILIGPVVKIDPHSLPRNQNIHYLGSKTYNELPGYLSGWDIALIPFAINESTQYISPTKTPEYLAAGKPVISTPITDVINPYGKKGLVHIINNATQLVEKATIELNTIDKTNWLGLVDNHLRNNSWDFTWQQMHNLVLKDLAKKNLKTHKTEEYV